MTCRHTLPEQYAHFLLLVKPFTLMQQPPWLHPFLLAESYMPSSWRDLSRSCNTHISALPSHSHISVLSSWIFEWNRWPRLAAVPVSFGHALILTHLQKASVGEVAPPVKQRLQQILLFCLVTALQTHHAQQVLASWCGAVHASFYLLLQHVWQMHLVHDTLAGLYVHLCQQQTSASWFEVPPWCCVAGACGAC